METREVVEKYFEFVNSHKWDDYLGLFADDIIMDEQLMGHIEGIDTLRKGIEGLRNATEFQNCPQEIVVEGTRAMAIWHLTTLGPRGEKISGKGVNFYKIEAGKIKYFANFHDTKPFDPLFQ